MRGWWRGISVACTLAAGLGACQFADETLWPDSPPDGIETRGQAAVPQQLPSETGAAGETALEPLMVVRSDRPDIAFETPLSQTVEQVLRLRPEARFDLVAVRPGRGSPSARSRAETLTQQQAERMLKYLAGDLGLAPERLSLTATTNLAAETGEVRLYLR